MRKILYTLIILLLVSGGAVNVMADNDWQWTIDAMPLDSYSNDKIERNNEGAYIGGIDSNSAKNNKIQNEWVKNTKENCKDKKLGLVGYDGGVCSEGKSGGTALLSLMQNGINWVIGIAFLLAVLSIFYAGFILVTAGGQPAKRTQAISILKNVIIGLFLISASWLLVDWIFDLFKIDDAYQFTKNN